MALLRLVKYFLLNATASVCYAAIFSSIALFLPACSLLKEKQQDDSDVELKTVLSKPLPPEKGEKLLNEVGSNWLYGQGMGDTAVTVGSVVLFPPYAIYVLGNGILSLSGYEPVHVTDALPDNEREGWSDTYNAVASGPGRLASAVTGHEFRNEEVAKVKIKEALTTDEKTLDTNPNGKDPSGKDRPSYQTGN